MNIGSVRYLCGTEMTDRTVPVIALQKVIESWAEQTKHTNTGHTHKMIYLFERNIHALSAGCMQFQTAFMMGKKLAAHVGFFVVDFEEANGEVISFCPTFFRNINNFS